MSKLIDEAEDAMLSVLGAGLDKNKELKRQAKRVKILAEALEDLAFLYGCSDCANEAKAAIRRAEEVE